MQTQVNFLDRLIKVSEMYLSINTHCAVSFMCGTTFFLFRTRVCFDVLFTVEYLNCSEIS